MSSMFSASERQFCLIPAIPKAKLPWTTIIPIAITTALFASGCGNSPPPISVSISPSSEQRVQQGQAISVTASVTNDSSSKGVAWSLSASDCTGLACGSLTNQTQLSVTYNASSFMTSDVTVNLIATSVADPSKFASVIIVVPAATVTIQPRVNELAAGTLNSSFFNARFNATVQNDPAGTGVTWTLTANGTPCSPSCGTLSGVNPVGVIYTPPATVPAAPNNTPTITATSVSNPAKSDTDTFTIFDGTSVCAAGGSEGLLNGQYAIMLQGWIGTNPANPLLLGASFATDGTGKITGGQDQVNPFVKESESGAAIIPSASSYSVGPDNRGCLTLTDQNETTLTFRFSLGGIASGIASKGDIIFFNQQSTTPERASGILRRQDPSAFSLSALAPNFAFGLDGWENAKGPLNHWSFVGSAAQSGGNLSGAAFDANDGGSLTQTGCCSPGIVFGTIQPIATADGMASATLFVPGPSPGFANVTVYVISSSELFIISFDLSNGGAGVVFSGRAIATTTSFTPSSVLPSYIFRFTGGSSGAPAASVGLASFSGGISGTVSGTFGQYAGGAATNQNLSGSYAFTELSGRLGVTGPTPAASPICYLSNPLDGVSAFCLTLDNAASLGVFDTQPAATYSNSSLSGNFFFGSNEPADPIVPGLSGIASISSGSLQGVQDASQPSGFALGTQRTAALAITANGTGNLGPNTVAVTNGTTLYLIDQSGTVPALVQVFEQ
jgi:hypothetical protein